MSALSDFIGHWQVLDKPGAKWLCRCTCGTEKLVAAKNLRSGRSKSCGCQIDRTGGRKNRRHGMDGTPTYRSWINMRRRCSLPHRPEYPLYGGRGIEVCDEWMRSFDAFFRDMGERPEGTSLDRIDNDGPYEKGNCRWAPPKVQARNRRGNRIVNWKGREMCLAQACEESGLSRDTLRRRFGR